jgi:hypothetical protein
VYVDDPTVKKYTLCMMQSCDFVDESGDFLVVNIRKKFRQVISDEVLVRFCIGSSCDPVCWI